MSEEHGSPVDPAFGSEGAARGMSDVEVADPAASKASSPVFVAVATVLLLIGAVLALVIASETSSGFLGRGFQLAVAGLVLGAGVLGSALAGLIGWWRREEPTYVKLVLTMDGFIGPLLLLALL